MPSTAPYNPTFDFSSDPSPASKVNATALQNQLNLISQNLSDLITALSVSIADDNGLSDEIVRLDSLHPEVATLINQIATGTVASYSFVWKLPVRVATTTNILLSGATPTIDGVVCVAGDRILVKNQTVAYTNGIWIVTSSGPWTRATDLPSGSMSGYGWAVMVQSGTANGGSAWAVVAGGDTTPLVGTDALTFMSLFGPFPYAVASGGTGATTALAARISLGVAASNTFTITGDGSTTGFFATHSLNNRSVMVQVFEVISGETVDVDVVRINTSQVYVQFVTAPALSFEYTVVITGAQL